MAAVGTASQMLFGGMLGLILLGFAVFLVILAILMPYYVYKCRFLLQDLLKENQKTNGLLRQLLKAYGHDPEG
ncbi:MAG: hypothetical protein EBZ78_10480 [Verrucomicrobia bacterium]|nr:hypothetical protein [Verrucomicrobiota bacterium]